MSKKPKPKAKKLEWAIQKRIEWYGKEEAKLVLLYSSNIQNILKDLNTKEELIARLINNSIYSFSPIHKSVYVDEVMEQLAYLLSLYKVDKEYARGIVENGFNTARDIYLDYIMQHKEG